MPVARRNRLAAAALVLLPAMVAGCPDADITRSGQDEIYQATVLPLNAQQLAGEVLFGIDLDQDLFIVQGSVTGVAPGVTHMLNVHEEVQCPSLSADLNQDGFIDATEAVNFAGRILLPLDDDLGNQRSGEYPVAHSAGRIFYDQETSLSELLEELRTEDPEPDPLYVRLPPGGELLLIQRSVVLFGVAPETPLPTTVAALPGMTRQQSLPIACGSIIQLR